MGFIIKLLIVSIAAMGGAYFLPNVSFTNFWAALGFALLLGIFNALIKPILLILTLPINVLTLGLFTLVINAIIILLIGALMESFKVDGFLSALIFSIILSVLVAILEFVFPI